MAIQLQTTGYPLAVSPDFINMLQQRINHHGVPSNISRITVKLTDPKYEKNLVAFIQPIFN